MKKLLLILLGLSALLAGSCAREEMEGGLPGGGGTFPLSVSVQAIPTGVVTRASVAPQGGEDTIGSLYLLFFAPTADRSGQYEGYVEVDMPEGVMGMNVDTHIDLTGTPLTAANAYHILAIANIADNFYTEGDIDSWMSQWNGKSESEVMVAAIGKAPAAVGSDGLLMHGRMEKPAGEDQAHLLLERNTARFDVVNSEREGYDLWSVSIWNAYSTTSVWGDGIMDYSASVGRIRSHYKVENEGNEIMEGNEAKEGVDGLGPLLNDIIGGLYTFENQVSAPQKNDNLTTCLIIGMRERATGKRSYYRVNMLTDTKSQILRRNYAYRLTIDRVEGEGATTEEIAYLGQSNKLKYTIGRWNLDDNGLIVQDEYSVLSIPTKTVTIGKNASSTELSIYTFSSLPGAQPLTVRSQTYRPAGDAIQARLDGNTLVIEASALPLSETERYGVIVLSYAGLETSINVMQSGVHDDYLRVMLPDGGIPRFPAYAGISSGLVSVESTGPWTARIYLDGFSFNPSTALDPVKTITSADALVVNDPANPTIKKFRIYTHSFNMDERFRESFIVVELDKDPDTYSSVIRLSQENVKKIYLRLPTDPEETSVTTAAATFNGAGTALVSGIAGNSDTFVVKPGLDETNKILPWNALLVMNGSSNDTGHFEIVAGETHHHATDPYQNTVKVKANGMNISGRDYTAILRVQTDPGTFADIIVTQRSATFSLSPVLIVDRVLPTGGTTEWVTVDTDAGEWTASKFLVNSSNPYDGRRLIKHPVTLEVEGENPGDDPVPFVEGESYPASRRFRVKFPKLYYPNRDIDIGSLITIRVGGMEQVITASQAALKARPMVGYGMTSAPFYSGLYRNGENYFQAWEGRGERYGTSGLRQIPGWSHLGSTNDTDDAFLAVTSIDPSVTYLQIVPHIEGTRGQNYDWAVVNDYIDTRDAWTLISSQDNQNDAINNPYSPLKRAGYGNMLYGTLADAYIYAGHAETKIHQFFFEKGHTELSPITTSFHVDGVNNSIPIAEIPATGVILMRKSGDHTNRALVVIDIRNKFIWFGESQVFWHDTYLTPTDFTFLENIMYFIGNASKFGSHFTDMFLEESHVTPADRAAGIIPMPAPWDPYWDDTANGGTDNRGVPHK